jgi:hypothetical protein
LFWRSSVRALKCRRKKYSQPSFAPANSAAVIGSVKEQFRKHPLICFTPQESRTISNFIVCTIKVIGRKPQTESSPEECPFWDVRQCAFVKTEVSEELSASIITVTRNVELGTTLAITSNRISLYFFAACVGWQLLLMLFPVQRFLSL